MAYTNVQSGEIPEGTQYYSGKLPLGDYDFYLQFDATGDTPTVVARCDSPDGIRAAASKTLPRGAKISHWSIEANDTEATVFVLKETPTVDIGDFDYATGISGCSVTYLNTQYQDTLTDSYSISGSVNSACFMGGGTLTIVWASRTPFSTERTTVYHGSTYQETYNGTQSSFDGQTYYYASHSVPCSGSASSGVPINGIPAGYSVQKASIKMLFGGENEFDTVMVGRFAIDLKDAGGYPGGGGGWISPGDWNIDPTTTLRLTVNGALSGRHNDPLDDPSFSYVPADNTAQAGYGCGGDGGHGGGGGAGASTIIVRQFATNKANSKDILSLAKRHGYGSGGGKGGKGGDGCILIYY